MYGFQSFINRVLDSVKPAVAILWAAITWVMFPESCYIGWCVAVWIGALLDLLTRWYAIFKKNGGIAQAFKTRAWNSEAMYHKTSIKIISYLVIQILAGLSVRFVSIPYISTAVAAVIYSFLFFREFASNIENLIEAGAEYLRPLLFWIKKKEKEVLKSEEEH